MKISSTAITGVSASTSIVDDINFLCQTDDDQYPLPDKVRNINTYYQDVVTAILEVQDAWDFDDSLYQTYPIATTTLVDGQKDYTLPSDLVKLLRLEYKDAGGTWQKLRHFDEKDTDIALEEMSGAGSPKYYRTVGNAIELYPAPSANSVTLTGGLKCYFQRPAEIFTAATSPDTEPGFAPMFHRILSVGPAFDFCNAHGKTQTAGLKLRLDELFRGLKNHYARLNREVVPTVRVRSTSFE